MKKVLVLILAVVFVFGAVIVPASDVSMAKKKVKAPARVTGVSITLKKDVNLTVKWYKAKRASKYQVYMKAGKSKWKKVKTTKKRVFKIKGKYNTRYYFKIRGVKGKQRGKFSAVSSMRTYKKPGPVIIKPDKDEEDANLIDDEKKDEANKDENKDEKKDEEKKDNEKEDVTPAISLLEMKSHIDKEYNEDGKKVVRKSTKIEVKVRGAEGRTLSWYQIPQKNSYDDPEFLRKTGAFTSNKSEATFYMTEGKKEKYVYCSFTTKDGKEIKSEIFTVPEL